MTSRFEQINMEYFNSFDYKCELCFDYKNHFGLEESSRHRSCICIILCENPSVCCLRGFKFLIEDKPYLINQIKIIPNNLYISKTLYISYNQPLIISNLESNIYEECKHIINEKKKVQLQKT